MGTPITRESMSNITALGSMLRTVWFDQIQAVASPNSLLNALFNVQTSNAAVERNQGVGGFGNVPEYTGTLSYDDFELLYQASYTHKEYAKGMAVERKLIDDDQYNVMNQRARLLGLAFDRTIETHAASVFKNAFSSSYLGGDSKALCATDHPYSSTISSSQSNKGTSALTHDSLISAKQAMMRFVDSQGNPLMVVPDTILVPVELGETARVIVESQLRSGVANNDTNVNTGYQIITTPYLSDTNNWFLIDSRMAKMYLNWYWRVMPEFAEDPTSDYSLVMKYRGYMRYSFGWDHWNWVYGSEVA